MSACDQRRLFILARPPARLASTYACAGPALLYHSDSPTFAPDAASCASNDSACIASAPPSPPIPASRRCPLAMRLTSLAALLLCVFASLVVAWSKEGVCRA